MTRGLRLIMLMAVVLVALPAAAQGKVKLHKLASFSSPTFVTGAAGFPKLEFVTEQGGRVRVLRGSHKVGHAFLDIRSQVQTGGEDGLLSIAFPPDYAQSGLFYVAYTTP